MEPIILPRISEQKPLVTVVSITYNHEQYIRDCLEGFLMQKTNFPVEIIIHDDASTDHTAEIIREYYEKRPDLFHVIIERENQFSQHKNFTRQIYGLAKGKYIAMCEGDDYWIDPLKLQKQADLCEKDNNVVGCVGYYIQDRNGTKRIIDYHNEISVVKKNKPVTHYFQTSTCFFRTSAFRNIYVLYKTLFSYMGYDMIKFACLCSLGDIIVIQEPLSCYRMTGSGQASSLTSKQHFYNLFLKQMTLLYLFGPKAMRFFHWKYCVKGLIRFIVGRSISFQIRWQSFRQLVNILLMRKKFCLEKDM